MDRNKLEPNPTGVDVGTANKAKKSLKRVKAISNVSGVVSYCIGAAIGAALLMGVAAWEIATAYASAVYIVLLYAKFLRK